MKKFFEALFTGLIAIVIIWGEFGGLYHTYTRHRDQFWLAVVVPPIAWYRGVEMFWHKEFSGKRWEKTKQSDAETMLFLLNSAAANDVNQVKLNEEIDTFSKKICRYPKKNRILLKTIYDDIAQYQLTLYDDFDEMMAQYKDPDSLSFYKSEKSMELIQKLIGHGLGEYIGFAENNVMDPMIKSLKDKVSDLPSEQEALRYIIGLRETMRIRKDAATFTADRISKKIFE